MAGCSNSSGSVDSTPVLTGKVTVTGTAQAGETLTADTSSLGGNGTISYQWKRGTISIGSNSNTYVVQSADVGSPITVTVTRSGYSGSVTSNPTSTIGFPPLTGTVTVTGTAQTGETLTAVISLLGGNGTISYQWKRGTTKIGSNSSTYVVQSADVGSVIIVTVTRSGYSGELTSEPTESVTKTESFNITLTEIIDAAPLILNQTISRTGNNKTVTITVYNSSQYSSIAWYITGTNVSGSGASFTLDSSNPAYDRIGEHFLTVEVWKDGKPYNKTIIFTVTL